MKFPSWRYHKTKEAVIVKCEVEDAALGSEWKHSPAHVHEEPVKEKKNSRKKGEK